MCVCVCVNIRLYFYSWRWYLCGAEKQSQKIRAYGVVGRRKSQRTTDFSQKSGTYIVYDSHVTSSNSSFSFLMVTPTSHFFAFHWLCFCSSLATCPSPLRWADASATSLSSTTSIGQGHIPIITLLILSSAGWSCLNIHRYTAPVKMMTFRWSLWSYQCICQQHPLYSQLQVTFIYYKWTGLSFRRIIEFSSLPK